MAKKKATQKKATSKKKDVQSPGAVETDFVGVLFIGDPHVDARTPIFRKDKFAETILKKIQWCLEYARKEKLNRFF